MLGVVSKSSGRADTVSAAIDVFAASGVSLVIHCGDVGGRHVLDPLARLGGAFVWGDRDTDRMGLLRYGRTLGVDCFGLIGTIDWEDKTICIVHGEDKSVIRRLLDEQQYDYLLLGHDLTPEDKVVGRTRIINPGAIFGSATPSIVLLDPPTGKLRVVPL
jgi:predicted phosphodiesterase